ncbi:hypothetical protein [Thiocapsa roseopersicina]|nr:hypothetical protein [Thiocapsa roseopersicina]
MGTRTVRLDDEAEMTLGYLRSLTGLLISEVPKRGLQTYAAQAAEQADRKRYYIYRDLILARAAMRAHRHARPRPRSRIRSAGSASGDPGGYRAAGRAR